MKANRTGSDHDSRDVGNAASTNEVGHTVRLADVAAQLRRRWRVILITTAVSIVAALTFSISQAPTYTAASVLTVNPVSVKPTSGSKEELNMVTEQAVITSIEVTQRATEIMESGEDPRDLAERIHVTSPADSQVLTIEATAESPENAATTANAVAEAYLENRAHTAHENINQAQEKLTSRIATLTEELENTPGNPAWDQRAGEVDNLRSQQNELATLVVDPGRVITVAAPPEEPSSIGALLYGAGGAVVGVLLGLGLALVRDRFDPHVHSGARLASVLGLSVLDYDEPELTDDVLDQLIARLGLDNSEQVVTVGLISADRTSWHWVGKQLDKHLSRYGIRVVFVPWQGKGVGDEHGLGNLVDHQRWKGRAQVVLVGAAGDGGVARAAWVGRWVDKVMITTWRSTPLATVRRLADELADNGNRAHLAVAVRDRKKPSPAETPVQDPGAATMQIKAVDAHEFVARARTNGENPAPHSWGQQPQRPVEQ